MSYDAFTERCTGCDSRLCTCPPPPECSTSGCKEPVLVDGHLCYWCAEARLETAGARP